jgi:sigma-B regulation protein RsbU (phosphoserine phosphatase)
VAGAEDQPVANVELDDAFFAALVDDDPVDLYENAPCAYLSAAVDGTILKTNATFLAWTGYTRSDLVGGRRFQDLLAPGDRIFYETHVAPMLALQGRAREVAADVLVADGQRLSVLINMVIGRNRDGLPVRLRIVLFDARERRAYERELLAARRRAEESEARARNLARTLQSTFLPPELPSVPGLDIGAAYRPAGDGSEVGGDFYDVFETGRGTWGVVLGDVCGKGAAAAVVTALARYTMRGEALRTPYPSAVLAALHDAMSRSYPDQFCTAVFATLEPGGRHLRLASGGHHLPLRRRADGTFDRLGRPGTILGMLDMPLLHDVDATLAPGDTVLLFTDGVVEARRDGEYFDEERLRTIIAETAALGARAVADAVVAAAVDFQGGNSRDDMAVIALRVPASEGDARGEGGRQRPSASSHSPGPLVENRPPGAPGAASGGTGQERGRMPP